MRWPFVLRSTADREVNDAIRDQDDRYRGIIGNSNALNEHNQALAQMLNASTERYDALLDKYHALKIQGASVPEPKPSLVPNKPQGPIAEAIDAVCERFGNSVKLRRRLMKYADDTKREAPDMDEADIAHSITHWKGPDDEEAA